MSWSRRYSPSFPLTAGMVARGMGGVSPWPVLTWLATHPLRAPELLRLARDGGAALGALRRLTRLCGPLLGRV